MIIPVDPCHCDVGVGRGCDIGGGRGERISEGSLEEVAGASDH